MTTPCTFSACFCGGPWPRHGTPGHSGRRVALVLMLRPKSEPEQVVVRRGGLATVLVAAGGLLTGWGSWPPASARSCGGPKPVTRTVIVHQTVTKVVQVAGHTGLPPWAWVDHRRRGAWRAVRPASCSPAHTRTASRSPSLRCSPWRSSARSPSDGGRNEPHSSRSGRHVAAWRRRLRGDRPPCGRTAAAVDLPGDPTSCPAGGCPAAARLASVRLRSCTGQGRPRSPAALPTSLPRWALSRTRAWRRASWTGSCTEPTSTT